MSELKTETVAELGRFLEKSQTTIRRWIKAGKLEATKSGNGYLIPYSDRNADFILTESKKRWERPATAYNPKELSGYSEWHQVLDEFTWLLKVCYSDKDLVRRRLFRTDIIFANYIKAHRVNLKKVRGIFSTNQTSSSKIVTNDLKRGWYNELAYTLPLKKSVLGLSFSDISINKEISDERFSFPSWRIISSYYSIYFYLRAVTLQKFDGFRLQEHGATISAFKHNLLAPFERGLWKFPFNITYRPKTRIYRSSLYLADVQHINLKISRHPRPPNNTPFELFEHIYQVFRKRSRVHSRPGIYTLFDYMHDFRVWANYLDIDNLLRLWGAGYKSFIDQNLSLLLFFIGGFAEISYMARFGVDKYIEQLQSIYDLFAGNVKELERKFIYTPLYHRLEIYNDLKLIDKTIKLRSYPDLNTTLREL